MQTHKNKNSIMKNKLEDSIKPGAHLKSEQQFKSADFPELQKEFINNFAHEIRSPLQGVLGFVSVLKENWRSFEKEEIEEHLAILENSCVSMLSLTNNLLDYSKFESGKFLQEVHSYNIVDIIDEVLRDFQILSYNKEWNITLNYEGDKSQYVSMFDKTQISKVMRNLLFNAVKYSYAKSIEISVNLSDKLSQKSLNDHRYAIIKVRDYGIGIPEDELAKIFDLYTQSSNITKKNDGSGLGLFISKQIIHQHKGKMWAQNNQDGPGAAFYFTLPCTDSISSAPNIVKEEKERYQLSQNISYTSDVCTLFVDDEILCLLSSKMMLESVGMSVVTAATGKEALDCIKGQKFNLIILDLMLEDMHGIEIIKYIRESVLNRDTPIIVQSGLDCSEDMNKAMTSGASSYIIKPFGKNQLLQEVEKHVYEVS